MNNHEPGNDFEKAAEAKNVGLMREIIDLLKHNKKWWLAPIIAVLLLAGLVIALGMTKSAAAPFIYTLF